MTKHPWLRTLAPVLAAAAFAACDRPATGPAGSARAPGDLAPMHSAGPSAIPGRYVVVLENGVASPASVSREMVAAHGGRLHYSYETALKGFAASLSPAAVDQLRRNPQVKYVAEDGWVTPDETQQNNATWGLDRIDQRALPLSTTFSYTPSGNGVKVYVIDTGIRTTHTEFNGRASVGADFVGDGRNGQDCHGHGTHVAGTIAGSTYGVAKNASVVAVRVFGCTGGTATSTVIAAVDWVTANAQKPAVANMSLGGSVHAPMNDAVAASIASGVVYAVAAGNENTDACSRSPASTPTALTVASSTSTDARSSFSNWGNCVDLFAPGSSITSAWATGDAAISTISGTSMAAPHVAGVAAAYLEDHPTATPATVAQAILSSGTVGAIGDAAGSPNTLLYSRLTPPAPPVPAPAIVLNKSSLSFTFLRTQGTAAAAPAENTPDQRFTASGGGAPRQAAEDAGAIHAATLAESTASLPIILSNGGTLDLNWNASSDRPWLAVAPGAGILTPGSSSTLDATVSSASLAPGSYTGTLTVRDTAAGIPSRYVGVTVRVTDVLPLQSGTPRTNLSGAYGSETFYAVTVPNGATSLSVTISGGTGDADLYVRYAEPPTLSAYNCRPYLNGNAERCDLSMPAPGTYYVMLRGWSSYSGVTLAANVTVPAPPLAPTNLAAAIAGPTSVGLTWTDRSSNEMAFSLTRRVMTGDTTWSGWQYVSSPAANTTAIADSALAPGGTYQYRISACNGSGCSSVSQSSPVTLSAPAAPTGAAAAAVAANRIQVTWTDASTTETSFTLARRLVNPDRSLGPPQPIGAVPANTTVFADSTVTPGQTYRYQVRACNPAGCSAVAATPNVTAPTIPPPPTNVAALATSGTGVQVTWTDASTNETSFTVARRMMNPDGSLGTSQTLGRLAAGAVSFADGTVTAGQTYRYFVRACNVAGCSAPGASANVAIPIP
ncbi:MAG TPA: S8 family serine peptidase [Longimicrobium sp.]|jgi:serine protease